MTPSFVEHYRESFSDPEADILKKIRSQVAKFASLNLKSSTTFDAQVFVGHPFVELVRAAQELSADLLVLGSHGQTSGVHDVGSVAARCVRKAPLPVLLVRDAQVEGFEKVVAGVDFSDTSRRALEAAAAIASCDGAGLRVVHVHSPPWMWLSHGIYDLKPFPERDYQDEYRSVLADQMDAFVAPCREAFGEVEFLTEIIERESSAHGLADYLKESAADLVVIGTRGRSGIKSLLLGTTAERLLRNSPCSVLTVKPEGFRYEP